VAPDVGAIVVRMTDPYRALWFLAVCGILFLRWTPRTRDALARRSRSCSTPRPRS
jgi:hypothetical protein